MATNPDQIPLEQQPPLSPYSSNPNTTEELPEKKGISEKGSVEPYSTNPSAPPLDLPSQAGFTQEGNEVPYPTPPSAPPQPSQPGFTPEVTGGNQGPYTAAPLPPGQPNYAQQAAADAPPPYYSNSQQPAGQYPQGAGQPIATVVTQPQSYPQSYPQYPYGVAPHTPQQVAAGAMMISIVVLFWNLMLCGWLGLLCSIPAVLLALRAKGAAASGDADRARTSASTAKILSVVSMFGWFFSVTVVIVGAAVGTQLSIFLR